MDEKTEERVIKISVNLWFVGMALIIGFFLGTFTGHVTVVRDDGTVCAEIK